MSHCTICYGAAIDVIIIMPVPNTRFRYDRLPPNQQPNPQHINVHSILIKSKSDAEETHYQSCLSFFFLSLGNRQATSNNDDYESACTNNISFIHDNDDIQSLLPCLPTSNTSTMNQPATTMMDKTHGSST